MSRFEMVNKTAAAQKETFTPERIATVHKALSGETRRELSCLHVVRDENAEPLLDIRFKNRDVHIRATDKNVEMTGEYGPAEINALVRITASLGWTDAAAHGNETDMKEALDAAHRHGQHLDIGGAADDGNRLAPLAGFVNAAANYTVHPGTGSTEKSPGMRLLKYIAERPEKIFNAARRGSMAAFRKVAGLVGQVYDYNEKPGVKVVAALSATAMAGGTGMTCYMVADKAHWAYDLMMERREEEKRRQEKVAEFLSKGLEVPKEIRRKKFLYEQRPWIKMAGHLAVRLGGTALLAAQYGPWSGAAFIGSIVVGKALWNAHLLQDGLHFLKTGQMKKTLKSPIEIRKKLADTLVKSAIFTSAAMLGLQVSDPGCIPGVSIGPTRWTGVDKMREFRQKTARRIKNVFRSEKKKNKTPEKSDFPSLLFARKTALKKNR